MERSLFIRTYPQTKLANKQSLGISLLTNIQLVDYYLHSSSNQIVEIQKLSSALPKHVKVELHILRTVFAHGVILRDYYIKQAIHISQEWEEFISWWENLTDVDVLDLVIYGIQESLDYYYTYLPTILAVEETMKGVSLETEQLKVKTIREKAIQAVLESWSVENVNDILPLYNDLRGIKKRILNLLRGFWESGFKEVWEKKRNILFDWGVKNASLFHKRYGTNEEAIYSITNLYPDTNEIEKINRAEYITFVPVPNMGRLMTYYLLKDDVYLMFEPSKGTQQSHPVVLETDDVLPAFEGLGDTTRVHIINQLATNKEMYAQQIVTALQLKQSTVSRHLNQLHQANLISVRQDGNTKYYAVNKEEIQRVITVLKNLIK